MPIDIARRPHSYRATVRGHSRDRITDAADRVRMMWGSLPPQHVHYALYKLGLGDSVSR
jgi:hypothetical protein